MTGLIYSSWAKIHRVIENDSLGWEESYTDGIGSNGFSNIWNFLKHVQTHIHTHTYICCTYSMCMLPAVVCTATTPDSQYHGERDKESTVNHLVSWKQIHCNNAAQSAICTDKILLSAERFNAGLTSLWKVDMWKSANHLYDCICKKRMLNTKHCHVNAVQWRLLLARVSSWI